MRDGGLINETHPDNINAPETPYNLHIFRDENDGVFKAKLSDNSIIPITFGSGLVDSVTSGNGITVDNTDPNNPIVALRNESNLSDGILPFWDNAGKQLTDSLIYNDTITDRIGINNTSPNGKLHITDNLSGGLPAAGSDQLVIENDTLSGITILGGITNADLLSLRFSNSSGSNLAGLIYTPGDDELSLNVGASNIIMFNDGTLDAVDATIAEIDAASNTVIVTKEWVLANTSMENGIFTASNSAGGSLVPSGFDTQLTDTIGFTGGNFGIGISTPSNNLHVVGGIGDDPFRIDTNTVNNALFISSNGRIGVGTSSTNRIITIDNSSASYIGLKLGGIEQSVIGADSTQPFLIFVNSAYRAVMDSSGNMSLGRSNTIDSDIRFDVRGDATNTLYMGRYHNNALAAIGTKSRLSLAVNVNSGVGDAAVIDGEAENIVNAHGAMVFNTMRMGDLGEKGRINSLGNWGIGDFSGGGLDASATNTLSILNGTEPSGSIENGIQIYAKDSTDGAVNSTLAFELEQPVEEIGVFTPSHKFKVWINGTEYWLQLDAVV